MQYRTLGNSEIKLSRIGLGTWAMGGGDWLFGWGPQNDEESIRTIYRALDLGINWIDTAAVYGLGHSEKVVGRALAGMSAKPFIATKCSRKQGANGELYSELKRESIIQEAEESLRRLRVETIDLYQLHWPRPEEDIEEGWETVAQLIKQGKVRYGGVSNFNVEQMQKCRPIMPITSLQPPYNMLVRTIEDDILDYCEQQKIGIVSYSPLYKGLFSGRFSVERVKNMPESDHRRRDPHFIEPELSLNLKLVSELSQIAIALGVTVAHLTFAWIFRHPQITSIIVGCRTPQQVEENVAIKDFDLEKRIVDEIENQLHERELALQVVSKWG